MFVPIGYNYQVIAMSSKSDIQAKVDAKEYTLVSLSIGKSTFKSRNPDPNQAPALAPDPSTI